MPKESISHNLEAAIPLDARELATEKKESFLEKRHVELSRERRKLEQALKEYNYDDIVPLFRKDALNEKMLASVVHEWRMRVGIYTELFDHLDTIGINIFTDALNRQSGFPGVTINFSSTEIAKRRAAGESTLSGLSYRDQPRIEIADPMPNLREQLNAMLKNGKIHPAVSVLIHELIHQFHRRHSINTSGHPSDETDPALTEAQAYGSGILELGKDFSLVSAGEILGKPKEKGGLYAYDHGKVARALMVVSRLSALEIGGDKIGQSIAQSSWDDDQKRFVPMEDSADAIFESYGLTDADLGALDDLYRMRVANQRLRARLILYETIYKMMPPETILEAQNRLLRSQIHLPRYPDKNSAYQFLITPVNNEFPYDPRGKKTGIIFGRFQEKSPLEFGIGKFEGEGHKGRYSLAGNEADVQRYIDIIAAQASQIEKREKSDFLDDLSMSGQLSQPLAERIARALVSRAEAPEVLLGYYDEAFEDKLAKRRINLFQINDKLIVLRQIHAEQLNELSQEKQKCLKEDIADCYERLDYIRSTTEKDNRLAGLFGLSVRDINPKIAVALAGILRYIDAIDSLSGRKN